MNDAIARAEIKRYVDKAYLAKLMQMNDQRLQRNGDLYVTLHKGGHSRNSSACVLGEVDIEEALMAELLHQTAELYIDAYERKGLKIGPEVMKDLAEKQVGVVATRKATLMAQAQLTAQRTNQMSKANYYSHLGKKASQAMMEIGPKIDLYNLTPQRSEPTPVVNNIFHLSGPGSKVVQGDDHSTNTITVNEKELFQSLASAITSAVADTAERSEILARLDELKAQKTKTDYLAMIPKFIEAATSIGHIIAPYLPALMEKAEQLGRG
jgi:hypothetical protein